MALIGSGAATPPRPGVVVGVDDRVADEAALRFGAEKAAALKLPLEPVHVYAAGHGGPRNLLLGFADPLLVAHQSLDSAIEHVQDALADVGEVRPSLVRGHVVRELVNRSTSAAMVVIGRSPYRGAGHGLRRSVPDLVVKHARCPVAVVPATWRPDPERRGEVVVAVARSRSCVPLLREGFAIARAEHRRLRLLELPSVPAVPFAPRRDGALALHRSTPLQQAFTEVAAAFPSVEVELRLGTPQAVEQAGADAAVVVMERHARWEERADLGPGSVARHLLSAGACPVIFVDPAGEGPASREAPDSVRVGGAPDHR